MSATAIVIGATGLVGAALTDRLAEAPHIEKIITLTRRPAPHASAKVENRVVDFARLEDYGELFRGRWLFSCLGTTRRQAGSIEAQRQVDLIMQQQAAELGARGGISHYLLVSSSGASAQSSNPYLKMKGELEEVVRALPYERISIFRPSLLLGERNHLRLGEKLGSWILPLLCTLPGLRRFRPIRGDQVAEKMVQVSTTPGPALEFFSLDEVFPDKNVPS